MNSHSICRWMVIAATAAIAACASQRPAPVVDRSATDRRGVAAPQPTQRVATDGMYTVRAGDTLQNVAGSFTVDARDLARWNDLSEGSVLRPGQVLRVIPPAEVATVNPITRSGQAEVRPLPPSGDTPSTAAPLPPLSPSPPSPAAPPPSVVPPASSTPPPTAAVSPEAVRPASGAASWQWPTAGKVIETFDDPRNKGIDIAGTEGAPVMAAADGEVVYVGSAVRGYGNLVIVRHNDDYITAYAHNRKVLVTEKQAVKRGQTIAELGRSDADRPKLHFELRHQGKPVDPLKYLPAR